MNNEIGRKITSLTLMTIMVAGGLTFAVPGVMPAAHAANANLFVSAENSQFDNYMSGPQVIEVVVIDSDINDTDEAKGEPDVTVNGKILRMVQAVDGNWYGYFADALQASTADQTSTTNGEGLDFGEFCDSSFSIAIGSNSTVTFTDTDGVAIPTDDLVAGAEGDGTTTFTDCTDLAALPTAAGPGDPANDNNVVREAKDVNKGTSTISAGQIGLGQEFWPVVQLYQLNPTGNVVVQYNKGGGVQSTTLTFDTVENFASLSLDRAVYPQGAQVHATVTDLWLNIDPTDEDSWTFGSVTNGSASTNYQVFDENGDSVGNTTANTDNGLTDILGNLMCEDNCVLLFNPDVQGDGNVVTIQDNDDSNIVFQLGQSDADDPADFGVPVGSVSNTVLPGKIPITITEQGPNSGVFGTYDESDKSVLKVIDSANRGTSASLDYNETPVTILVGHSFATIDIQPIDDEWTSGEEIPVVVVDGDANKNSRADEDLDLNDPTVDLIPALSTGDPVTLGEAGNATYTILYATGSPYGLSALATESSGLYSFTSTTNSGLRGAVNTTDFYSVQDFSQRAILGDHHQTTANGDDDVDVIVLETAMTGAQIKATVKDTTGDADDRLFGVNLLNIDLRSFNSTATVDVFLLNASSGTDIVDDDTLSGDTLSQSITAFKLADDVATQSLTSFNGTGAAGAPSRVLDAIATLEDDDVIAFLIEFSDGGVTSNTDVSADEAFVVDLFSFGFTDDGVQTSERVANQIVRIEAEETGDNTSTFEGSLEYVMVNQLNILDADTFTGITPIADDPSFIVIEDLTDEDAPRVSYNDLGADGVVTPISDQEEAPSHSGVVSLNQDSYKIGRAHV